MTKVLLVDDDEMGCDMLSRRLIRRGFEVIVAVDGEARDRSCAPRKARYYSDGHELTRYGRVGSDQMHQV